MEPREQRGLIIAARHALNKKDVGGWSRHKQIATSFTALAPSRSTSPVLAPTTRRPAVRVSIFMPFDTRLNASIRKMDR